MYSIAEGKTAKRSTTQKKRGLSNVRGGKGAASRTVGLLGAIFTYAVRRGMRDENPVRGVERFADNQRLRRLTENEYLVIAKAYSRAASENIWPPLLSAAHFLIVTGWRTGEVIGLKWEEVGRSGFTQANRHSWRHKNGPVSAASAAGGVRHPASAAHQKRANFSSSSRLGSNDRFREGVGSFGVLGRLATKCDPSRSTPFICITCT